MPEKNFKDIYAAMDALADAVYARATAVTSAAGLAALVAKYPRLFATLLLCGLDDYPMLSENVRLLILLGVLYAASWYRDNKQNIATA